MRINVYSQELTDEVITVRKESNTGRIYDGAQLVMHSSPMLHHPPEDDDRTAITFWLPSSDTRRESMAKAFEKIASIFRSSIHVHDYDYSIHPAGKCRICGAHD